MNNKNLAIGALIVVLLSGVIMYVMKPSETETAAVETPAVEQAQQVAAAQPEPIMQEQSVESTTLLPETKAEPKSLGASSSGLGR